MGYNAPRLPAVCQDVGTERRSVQEASTGGSLFGTRTRRPRTRFGVGQDAPGIRGPAAAGGGPGRISPPVPAFQPTLADPPSSGSLRPPIVLATSPGIYIVNPEPAAP